MLDVIGLLVPRPLSAVNITAAATFRTIEAARPTLLIDEADTFLGENEEWRGILNSGHRAGGAVPRTVGDDHEVRVFSTHCPLNAARPAGCWAPSQEKLAIEQTSGRQRINIHGAIDLETGQTRMIFWTDFLRKLRRRGLRGVKLVISDAHEGIKAAVAKVMKA